MVMIWCYGGEFMELGFDGMCRGGWCDGWCSVGYG